MENEITNNDQTKKILGFKSAMESVKESLSEDEINIDDIQKVESKEYLY